MLQEVGDEVDVATARHQQAIFNLMAYEWERSRALSSEGEHDTHLDATVGVSTHHFAGLLALAVGDLDRARKEFEAADEALADVPASAPPFFTVITVCWVVDDRGSMLFPVGEDSMLLGRRIGAEQAHGHIAAAMAIVERLSGRIPSALELLDDVSRRFVALGDVYGQAYATGQRGHTFRWSGDLDGAVRCFDEAEALRVSVRDVRAIAMSTAGRSFAEALAGRVADARRHIGETIARMRQTGDVPGAALSLNNVVLIEMIAGDQSTHSTTSTRCWRWARPSRYMCTAGTSSSWQVSVPHSATPTVRPAPPPTRRPVSSASATRGDFVCCKRAQRGPDHHVLVRLIRRK